MLARIWGCRGSIAAPGPATVRYGGNTSCVEVRPSDGRLVVIDAGTGARALAAALDEPPPRIDILLSHLHLDHIEGLGFFGPIWSSGCEVHLWGPGGGPDRTLLGGIRRFFGPPIFPVPIHEVPSNLVVHEVWEDEFDLGPVRVCPGPVEHPGPTLGFRLREGEATLAYISDHEPARLADLRTADPETVSGHALARGADVLLHDGQYSEEEYQRHVGWGHSSVADAVAFAHLAKARDLVLFHHDPGHTDEDLDGLGARARELWGRNGGRLLVASEGMEIEVLA